MDAEPLVTVTGAKLAKGTEKDAATALETGTETEMEVPGGTGRRFAHVLATETGTGTGFSGLRCPGGVGQDATPSRAPSSSASMVPDRVLTTSARWSSAVHL